MRPEGCEANLLRILASMPFLDRQEMVAVSGWSRAAVYEAVQRLETGGVCASVLHAADPLPQARRFHLTAAGLSRFADEEDRPLEGLVRDRPLSAQWRRSLMERLDALAVIYHLASVLSGVAYPIRFRWYRAMPLDAAMTLPDGKTVGIVRQGLTADRSGFAKRLWRLRDGPMPGTVLVLMADDVRLRHAPARSPTGRAGHRRRRCRPYRPHRRPTHRPVTGGRRPDDSPPLLRNMKETSGQNHHIGLDGSEGSPNRPTVSYTPQQRRIICNGLRIWASISRLHCRTHRQCDGRTR